MAVLHAHPIMSEWPIDDVVCPFQLERSALRGRAVRLDSVIDQVLTRHGYPEPVQQILGELLTLTATMAGGLKFDGTFSLQVKSDGPISLMVADCTNDGAMRGYAGYDAAALPATGDGGLGALLGHGHLAFTVEQQRPGTFYQGVVELQGATLSDAMRAYFRQSEQLRTGLAIAVERRSGGDRQRWRAGGIIIQALADQSPDVDEQQQDEDWRRTMLLLGTVTDAELVDPFLPAHDLLYRLFHEEGVRAFAPLELCFRCRCSRTRVSDMLRSFPKQEIHAMKDDDGQVVVTCQFCNAGFEFDAAQLAVLHAAS